MGWIEKIFRLEDLKARPAHQDATGQPQQRAKAYKRFPKRKLRGEILGVLTAEKKALTMREIGDRLGYPRDKSVSGIGKHLYLLEGEGRLERIAAKGADPILYWRIKADPPTQPPQDSRIDDCLILPFSSAGYHRVVAKRDKTGGLHVVLERRGLDSLGQEAWRSVEGGVLDLRAALTAACQRIMSEVR